MTWNKRPSGPYSSSRFCRALFTFGVNWYLNDFTRLMLNYNYAEPQVPDFGASSANLYSLRLAVHW